ncbi:hypothetical protein M405DRAFT_861499 [Rhizopogon salebrosus TDB-379]|nr:hypothetical protein M405DRAFT_861499 [Rhizopogon salebrosus TDB-379]
MTGVNHSPGQGTFGHNHVGGYDAGYYGYTYSLVLAADMHGDMFQEESVGSCLGKLYKDKILMVGGSREETELLCVCVSLPQFSLRLSPVAYAMEQDFLGRPPNSDTFLTEMFEQAPVVNL